MDFKNLPIFIDHLAEIKGLTRERIVETIEHALAAAYKKEYGKKGQIIRAKLNPGTGQLHFWQVKLVVDQDMIYSEEEFAKLKEKREGAEDDMNFDAQDKKVRFHPEKHIMFQEAQKANPDIRPGDTFELELETKSEYGRISAQTAKQVILQKMREAERDSIVQEFKSKEGELVSGIIQRIEGKIVFVDLGKTLGILPAEEQTPGEFYRPGQRMKFYCVQVMETSRGPQIYLSRIYPKFISKLFELEVPEISAGTLEIKAITREAGSRSKIAAASKAEGVDPVGAMVGQRGTRVTTVINELGGEKIDIIAWAQDPETYIANALSPAKTLQVQILPKNRALAIVAKDQLSLAIGREGQNVRLAAKLTGWKIDIRTPEGTEVKMEEEPS